MTFPFSFGVSPQRRRWLDITALTFTWTSDGTARPHTADVGYVSGEIVVGDVVEFQLDKVTTFDGGDLQEPTNTLDSGEIGAGAVSLSISDLSAGTWYGRARIRRGTQVSDWSDYDDLVVVAAWTPASITGGVYFLWSDTATVLKADANAATNQTPVTTNGDGVYGWTSQGAVTKTPVQVTSSKRPSWHSTNGITFDGTDDILILLETLLAASFFSQTSLSVFIKATFSSSNSNMIFLGEGTTANANALYAVFRSNTAVAQGWQPYIRNNAGTNTNAAASATGYRNGVERVHGVVVDRTNNQVVFLNNWTPESADTITHPGTPASFDRFFLGGNSNAANQNGTEYMACTIKAIVVFPGEYDGLSAGDQTELQTWFTNIG